MYSIHSLPKLPALATVADGWLRRFGDLFSTGVPAARPPQVFIYRRKLQRQRRMRVA